MLDLTIVLSCALVCAVGYWVMGKIDSFFGGHMVQYDRANEEMKENGQSGTDGIGARA